MRGDEQDCSFSSPLRITLVLPCIILLCIYLYFWRRLICMGIRRLHGERHLERANIENSSQAYDNKLLSKIGKPRTPPRTSSLGNVEASPTSSMLFHQDGKYPHKLKSLSLSDGSMSAAPEPHFKKEPPSSRLGDSPRSRAIPPGLISSAASAKNYMDYRSPPCDASTPLSAAESEQQARFSTTASGHPSSRGFVHRPRRVSLSGGGGSVFSNFDESAAGSYNSTASDYANRAKRTSHDQSLMSAEPDSAADFPMEETGALGQLHLEDRPPPSFETPYYYSSSADARSGMSLKRRASSPPPEAAHDDKALHAAGSSTELYQRSTAHLTANRGSPINRFAPIQHGSISSSTSSSGLRNGSYASSGGLSVGGSSISSISTHERLSPGGLSPASDQLNTRDLQHNNSLPMTSSPRDSLSRPHQRTPSDTKSAAAIARKMSSEHTGPRKLHNAPGLQAHVHICECCPKKPKKFDTLEELK